MSLEQIVTEAAKVGAAIEGIKQVYERVPEGISAVPNLLVTVRSGTIAYEPDCLRWDHRLQLWLRVLRTDLPTAENMARPFVAKVVEAFGKNTRLNDTCEACWIANYEMMHMPFGAVPYFGVHFDLLVLEKEVWEFV
ncbi:MAG: hypothetical protein SVY53_05980 [Chloroflexota bacterium]|nr:hypothetical protein [Chloroflexota bacterium]